MVVFKKLNIELPYDPAVPLLGINPKSFKAGFFFLTILLNIIDSYALVSAVQQNDAILYYIFIYVYSKVTQLYVLFIYIYSFSYSFQL